MHSFDASAITDTIQRALASAGLNTSSGIMKSVTDTIHQALATAGLAQRAGVADRVATTFDGVAREIATPPDQAESAPIALAAIDVETQAGEFLSRCYTNHAGTRTYRLYVPASYRGPTADPVPLVLMLHGCTQSPEDFARGTRMNALAEQHGFLVAYPGQAPKANGSRCWNWFRVEDQRRDHGEPSILTGMTREIMADHHIDDRRVFVAGMSAGAAMAVILGATYPELYAAVGAHSGLPYGSAHDVPSAFGVMKSGAGAATSMGQSAVSAAGSPLDTKIIPTIVFHGDSDQTVNARNGATIVAQATAARSDSPPLRAREQTNATERERSYSRTVYRNAANEAVVEHWILHGGGHAWSGGSAKGSFTDASGPDASAQMIRFFFAQSRGSTLEQTREPTERD